MKPIDCYTNRQLASIYTRVKALQQLEATILAYLPAAFQSCVRVCNYENQALCLGCTNPEASSALRFHLPQLRDLIRRQLATHPITSIRIIALSDPIQPLHNPSVGVPAAVEEKTPMVLEQ